VPNFGFHGQGMAAVFQGANVPMLSELDRVGAVEPLALKSLEKRRLADFGRMPLLLQDLDQVAAEEWLVLSG
jgi:hypothetical protein